MSARTIQKPPDSGKSADVSTILAALADMREAHRVLKVAMREALTGDVPQLRAVSLAEGLLAAAVFAIEQLGEVRP
jgi:hypothetical protein